jgi:hypothetical protein
MAALVGNSSEGLVEQGRDMVRGPVINYLVFGVKKLFAGANSRRDKEPLSVFSLRALTDPLQSDSPAPGLGDRIIPSMETAAQRRRGRIGGESHRATRSLHCGRQIAGFTRREPCTTVWLSRLVVPCCRRDREIYSDDLMTTVRFRACTAAQTNKTLANNSNTGGGLSL